MQYIFGCDIYFIVDADNYEQAINKAWEKIYANLPECFNTEGSELWDVGEE